MSKDNSQESSGVSTGDTYNDSFCSSDHGGFDTCTPPAGDSKDTGKNDTDG